LFKLDINVGECLVAALALGDEPIVDADHKDGEQNNQAQDDVKWSHAREIPLGVRVAPLLNAGLTRRKAQASMIARARAKMASNISSVRRRVLVL